VKKDITQEEAQRKILQNFSELGITEGYHKYKKKAPQGVANMKEMVFNHYL
jgi:hypothetical protein